MRGGQRWCEVAVRFVRTRSVARAVPAGWDEPPLGAAERLVLDRLRPPAERGDYLAAHLLARVMLADASGARLEQVAFDADHGERPEVLAPAHARSLSLSLAHADGLAVCAVAGVAVGVGVESARNLGADPLAVADLVCSRAELDRLRSLPLRERSWQVLAAWVVKEAVAKASGLGFAYAVTEIEVPRVSPDSSARMFHVPAASGGGYRLATWRPTPSHFAALAIPADAGSMLAVRFNETSPALLRSSVLGAAACA